MINQNNSSTSFKINVFTPIVYLIIIITNSFEIFLVLFFCAFLHEAAHIIAMKIVGADIQAITLLPFGASVKLGQMPIISYKNEMFISLCAPLLNGTIAIIFIIIAKMLNIYLGFLIACNLIMCFMNLMPVSELDGGRALSSFLKILLPLQKAELISDIISVLFLVPIIALGIYFLISTGYNFSLLLIGIYLSVNFMFKNFKNRC